jgi:drug/metabolite transporter (DMT)-like permease
MHTTWNDHWIDLDWQWLIMGIMIGSGSAWGNDVFMRALKVGPASLTSPLTNMNIVLVVLMGTLWFGESLSGWQLLAIASLLVAIFLLAYQPNSTDRARHLPWIWFTLTGAGIILFAVRNGGLKISLELGMANDAILAIAYLWSLLWFLPPAVRLQWHARKVALQGDISPKDSDATNELQPSSFRCGLLWGIGAGICSYGGMQLYAIALEFGNINVVAPVFATNSLVIVIGSLILFKERLRKLQWLALLLIMLGLIWIRWTV